MYGRGHHGLNALLFSPVAFVLTRANMDGLAILGGLFFVGVASLPDIDRHFAGMSSRSDLLELVPISHRGFTHTIFFSVFCYLITAVIGMMLLTDVGVEYTVMTAPVIGGFVPNHHPLIIANFIGVCIAGGVIGHIIGDLFTPMGVTPFEPIKSNEYTLRLFNASNTIANYAFFIVGFGSLIISLNVL